MLVLIQQAHFQLGYLESKYKNMAIPCILAELVLRFESIPIHEEWAVIRLWKRSLSMKFSCMQERIEFQMIAAQRYQVLLGHYYG